MVAVALVGACGSAADPRAAAAAGHPSDAVRTTTPGVGASTAGGVEVAAVLRNKWLPSTSPLASGMSSALQGFLNYKAFIGASRIGVQLPKGIVFADAKATLRGIPLLVWTDVGGDTLYVAATTPT